MGEPCPHCDLALIASLLSLPSHAYCHLVPIAILPSLPSLPGEEGVQQLGGVQAECWLCHRCSPEGNG